MHKSLFFMGKEHTEHQRGVLALGKNKIFERKNKKEMQSPLLQR
jgi:hypothetical protein